MNPYEVLGVGEDADEETVKRAYRELVKKYHPDRYMNNPLADLAGEKIKQINEAYDTIMSGRAVKSRQHKAAASGGDTPKNGANADNTYRSEATFENVRLLISRKSFSAAETMLMRLPCTAEWYYLSGVLHMRRGWYTEAHRNIARAVQMEPDNDEYRRALNVMNENADEYREFSENKKPISMKDCYFEDNIKKSLSLLSCAAGCCICFDCYCDWCMGVRPMLQICRHML